MPPACNRRVDTEVGALHVHIKGKGPPAVLWHSLMVDSGQWDRVRDGLALHRTLVVIDGPGHGRSGPPPPKFTLGNCADAAGQVLDAVGVGPAVDWLGNAWGGHVGYLFAGRFPDQCRSLVAVAAPPNRLPGRQLSVRALLHALRLLGPNPLRGAVAAALLSDATRKSDPAAVEVVQRGFSASNRAGMHRAIEAMMLHRTDLTADLRRITAPTLLIAGATDVTWSPPMALEAAALIPDASVATVEGAGHLPPLERPRRVLELMEHFWTSQTRAGRR